MGQDAENELVGIVLCLMDRMGITKISFTDAELDIIEERCYHQSLVVEVDETGIHASITDHNEAEKIALNAEMH